eukprot:1076425-Prorocentrum_lima.AAC.1
MALEHRLKRVSADEVAASAAVRPRMPARSKPANALPSRRQRLQAGLAAGAPRATTNASCSRWQADTAENMGRCEDPHKGR